MSRESHQCQKMMYCVDIVTARKVVLLHKPHLWPPSSTLLQKTLPLTLPFPHTDHQQQHLPCHTCTYHNKPPVM